MPLLLQPCLLTHPQHFIFMNSNPVFLLPSEKASNGLAQTSPVCEIASLRMCGPLQSFWFHLLSDHKSALTTLLNVSGSGLACCCC